MTNDLRVEKRQEEVSLFMADGVVLETTVFLAKYAMFHSGEQTLLDLLLEDDPFFPAKTANGEFHLIRKGMINHIRCRVEIDETFNYIERKIKVYFLGGEELQGLVKMDMPSHLARLSDYINGGADFFPLFAGGKSYLVNRNLVRNLVLID